MHGGSSRAVVRHLRALYQFGVVGALSDQQLLEHYLARRDETADEAFAELVQRHGPMVLGACRRILGDAHDAEDAFQATFLALARKAASVVRREKLAGWLYIVAVRTAREAHRRAARHRSREERVTTRIYVEPTDEALADELRAILDEELARLPARQRDPVVLCELEGLSRAEAARRLGIPEGTLSSRLARAKGRLRDRLAARGVSLPAAAISATLIREARAVTVPLSLLESTVQAATLVATGPCTAAAISASVTLLTEGVLKTMFIAKLKGIAVAVGAMTAIVSGAVVLAQSGQQAAGPEQANAPASVQIGSGDDRPREKPQGGRGDGELTAQDDRIAALEAKVDRILQTLDRQFGTAAFSRTADRTTGSAIDAASGGGAAQRQIAPPTQGRMLPQVPRTAPTAPQPRAAIASPPPRLGLAEARLAMVQAEEKVAQAELTVAEQVLAEREAAVPRWNVEVQRLERLVSEGVVDPPVLGDSRNQLASSNANREEAKAALQMSRASLDAASAAVREAQALLDIARAELRSERDTGTEADLKKARAQLSKARRARGLAERDAARAGSDQAAVILAKHVAQARRWDSEVKRLEREVERGVVDPEVLTDSRHRLKMSQAARDASAAQVELVQARLEAAEARLKFAEAEAGATSRGPSGPPPAHPR